MRKCIYCGREAVHTIKDDLFFKEETNEACCNLCFNLITVPNSMFANVVREIYDYNIEDAEDCLQEVINHLKKIKDRIEKL